MKVKVKGLVFVGFAAMIFAANAMAEPAAAGNQNTVTSKAYTEATYQHKSSGASIGNTGGTWTAVDTAVTEGATSVPTTAAVKTYVDNQVQTAGGNYQTKSTAADENKVANGNGGWKALGTTLDTTAQGYDANNAVTAGTIAAALAENAANTTYTAGTNVQISADNEISATDTTYTAGSNITIDANNNNAIAATTGAVANDATTLVTGDAVYDYVQSQTGGTIIPTMDTTKCTASIPCALVAEANGEVHWRVMAVSEGQTPAAGTLADAQ